MADPGWQIEKLDRAHERATFNCGQPLLDEWLRRFASQYERRDLARTYVALWNGEARVLAYYSVSNHQVSFDALPGEQAKGLPSSDIPVVLLGRLAVDKSVQGQGLGEFLLLDALRIATHLSQHVEVRAVEVQAIDDAARRFYLKYGFVPLRDDRRHLFQPMHVVRQLRLPPL